MLRVYLQTAEPVAFGSYDYRRAIVEAVHSRQLEIAERVFTLESRQQAIGVDICDLSHRFCQLSRL